MIWIFLLVVVVTFLALLPFFVYHSANNRWQFSRLEEGNITFIVKGDDMKAEIPNVEGYGISEKGDMDGRHWLIKNNGGTQTTLDVIPWFWLGRWLWNRFGITPISIFYPQIKVHGFKVSISRIKEAPDVPEEQRDNLKAWVESEENREVSSLRAIVARPVLVLNAELPGDGAQVDILIQTIFWTVIPSLPVFYHKANHYPLLDAVVEAGVIDFLATYQEGKQETTKEEVEEGGEKKTKHYLYTNNKGSLVKEEKPPPEELEAGEPLTYGSWLNLARGPGSLLDQHLQSLNVSKEFIEILEKNDLNSLAQEAREFTGGEPKPITGTIQGNMPRGFIATFGLAVIQARVITWVPSTSTKDLANARRAKETQEFLADGEIAKAKGIKALEQGQREGIASGLSAMIEALRKEHGLSREQAAAIVFEQVRTGNIAGKDSKLTTYVEGGGSGQSRILISASKEESEQPGSHGDQTDS